MENITLGHISVALLFIYGLIDVISKLYNKFKNPVKLALNDEIKEALKPIIDNQNKTNEKLDNLDKKIDEVDINRCKDFLVSFFSKVEKGEEIDEVELEHFYCVYEIYINKGGNSYIHSKYEKLKKEGKL